MFQKKKSKVKEIQIKDMYDNIFIFLAGTPEEIRNYFYEHKLNDPVTIDKIEGAAGLAYNEGSTNIIMVMKDDIGVIIHECVHAIQHAMDDIGIDTGVANTEITAYGTEWLCKTAIPFYTKYFAKQKKNEQ